MPQALTKSKSAATPRLYGFSMALLPAIAEGARPAVHATAQGLAMLVELLDATHAKVGHHHYH